MAEDLKYDDEIFNKTAKITEEFFGTQNDPTQIPINMESRKKLFSLTPKGLNVKIINDEPVSWVVVVPTQLKLAEDFLAGKINERELFNLTRPQPIYEALYLCSAFTVPEFRSKGFALELVEDSINKIPHTTDAKLFSWPWTKGGLSILKRLEEKLNTKIEIKNGH